MNKKQKRLVSMIFGLIIIIVISLFLIKLKTPTGAAVADIQELNFAINMNVPYSAFIFIAEEKGYFADEGLKINYHNFPTGKLALDALIGGGADIATTADIPITLAGLAEHPISVIATIGYSNISDQVVARKDLGISNPNQLKGKTIATTRGGGPLFFTHKFLERYDIKRSEVNLVFLNPGDMVTALIKGDIDAFSVFEPFPYIAQRELKNKIIIFDPDDLYGETWNIVVMKDFDNRNPATLKRFLRALLKAETYLAENPEESLKIISKHSKIEEDILSGIMERQNYEIVLNNLLLNYLYKEAEWAIEEGFTSSEKIPDYSSLINRAYLQELKPEKVII